MGFDFHKFLKLAQILAPIALASAGVPAALIPLVTHGIQLAESHPRTGAEKKATALEVVTTGIAAVNAVKPGAVDPDIVKVVEEGIDAAVGAINAARHLPIVVS